MESRYKIIIANKNLYKEVELSSEDKEVKLGTSIDCDVRLRKDLFFGQIELRFVKGENGWSVLCSDNLYLTVGDVRKMMTKKLQHGDILFLKYQESDTDVFTIEFLIDFDNGKKKYERVINVANVDAFSIGSDPNSNIVITGPYVSRDAISVQKKGTSLFLRVQQTTYGVYHNGKKIDTAEEIKNGDFFSISDYFFYYKGNVIWAEIRDDMHINSLTYQDVPAHTTYPMFKRNTRVKIAVNDEKIEILDPPAKPQKPKNNIISRLLPSLVMVVAGIAMAFVSPFMLISSGIGIVTAIIGLVQGKKDFKNDSASRIEKYNNYIAKKRAEIEACRSEEQRTLEEIYISQQAEQARFNSFSSDLFDRTKDDEDFLCVRLGSGDVESKREIDYKKQEKLEIEDDLQQIPENLCNEFRNVHNAPIVCDLKLANAVGVIGPESFRFEIMKNMVIDIAARQYFSDVKMFFVADQSHNGQIHWLRMLPHVYNDDIGIRNMVCDDESKNIIFEYLYKELTNREQQKSFDTQLVVFFYDEYGFQSHPISKFVDKASELGVTFVFFGNTRGDIPTGCKYLVEINDQQSATLIDTEDRATATPFAYPNISNSQAASIVNLLAPVFTEEISLESSLTKNISMFELLNIIAVDDIDLKKRWANSQVFKSMAAPIGVSKTGIVSLDLHDKAHGPHGLVAGTTGSGKSEVLQTYILAMSTLFHPYEVGFVIIDFKGGGMVNQFRDLPHLLGAITNIDGKEINRSLKSIKAELNKRQMLFAEADVNHIDKYIRMYKSGEVSTPLPHLIIIVDEFAELKAEQPEFMKELISAARIGRSLGVHLILATQKPSGQVNEQIWSNSRFKLCLKVQSKEDSNEVLKSPLAAEIKEPGRAYLQVGNNEVFELFQSAYSGASEKADESNVKEFTIYNLNDSGRRIPVFQQKKQNSGEASATQLDAIVKYVADYCHEIKLTKLPGICLPPLEEVIHYQNHEKTFGSNIISINVGIYDDPDTQLQDSFQINMSEGHTVIIGSSQTGKTTLLQLIIRDLSESYSPDQVSIYIIDFASKALSVFGELNHVGGVVLASEDEKLKNLIRMLKKEMTARKDCFAQLGITSFSSYKEAGYTDKEHIVVIIDNFIALKELYPEYDDDLLMMFREGTSLGITFTLTALQTSVIGYKYLNNCPNRLCYYCNDSGEYSNVFDRCRQQPDNVPGRGLMAKDKEIFEFQTFCPFDGEREIEKVENIKSFINKTREKYGDKKANRIPEIPSVLTPSYIVENINRTSLSFKPYVIPVAMDYETVELQTMDLTRIGMVSVIGKEGSGKSNFVRIIISTLQNRIISEPSEVYLFDNYERKLSDFEDFGVVKKYTTDISEIESHLDAFEKELTRRKEIVEVGGVGSLDKLPLIVCVIKNEEFFNSGISKQAVDVFKRIMKTSKLLKMCFLLVGVENVAVSFNSGEILKIIKETRNILFMDNIANMKMIDISMTTARQYKKPLELGDSYWITEQGIQKYKMIFSGQEVNNG